MEAHGIRSGGIDLPIDLLSGLDVWYQPVYEDRNASVLRDLSEKRRADAALVSAPPWVAINPQGLGIELDGTADKITMEDNLLDGRAAGSMVFHLYVPDAANAWVLNDRDTTFGFVCVAQTADDRLTFVTAGGETTLVTGVMKWDQWTVIGFEWGPLGTRVYVSGLQVNADATKTAALGTGAIAPEFGHDTDSSEFTALTLSAFLLWDRYLGPANHRRLDSMFRSTT